MKYISSYILTYSVVSITYVSKQEVVISEQGGQNFFHSLHEKEVQGAQKKYYMKKMRTGVAKNSK